MFIRKHGPVISFQRFIAGLLSYLTGVGGGEKIEGFLLNKHELKKKAAEEFQEVGRDSVHGR